ncbi:MAG: DUF2062 domain-containing protein, partial [Acidobacteriota bacterium]
SWAEARGFTHVIVFDCDGRDDPSRVVELLARVHEDPWTIAVGRRREAAPSGRFWRGLCLRLACGVDVADVTGGPRVYPVAALTRIECRGKGPEFDDEIIARAIWAGLSLDPVDLDPQVPAPPDSPPRRSLPDRPGTAVTYARICLRNLNPWPFRRVFQSDPDAVPFSLSRPFAWWIALHRRVTRKLGEGEERLSLRHPLRSLKILHLERTSPKEISLACMLGVFLGALPLIALHTVAIVFYATRLRLNRAIAFYASNLCAPFVPPFVPALDIEVGHFLSHGRFITLADLETRHALFRTLCAEAHLRLLEYLLGSLVVGPILALLTGAVVFVVASARRRLRVREAASSGPGAAASPDYGGRLGHAIFYRLIRTVGVTPAYLLLGLVVPYYVIIRGRARRSASHYLRRRFPGRSPVWRFFATAVHFYRFGQTLIDQAALGILGPECLRVEFAGGERFRRLALRRRGLVMITSHVGNWQTAMARIGHLAVPVHFQFRLEEHTRGRHFFDVAGGQDRFRIVSPDGFMGGLIELTNALRAGECAAVMGDRSFGAAARHEIFLGAPAAFPVTPYHLAITSGADLIVLLTRRTGRLSVCIECVRIGSARRAGTAPRDEQIGILLKRYVRCLERYLVESPLMWFNFFDFWNGDKQTPDR